MKVVSSSEAVKIIQSNNNVYIHTAAAAPGQLVNEMVLRHNELENVNLYHMHLMCDASFVHPEYQNSFNDHSFFVGENVRKAVQAGLADYIPVFFSEIPTLFRKKIIPLDVAMIQVSSPDKHGYCSLGVSVETSIAAVQSSKYVIAQINPNMPRTHGDGIIHVDKIDFAVNVNDPIYENSVNPLTEIELQIGKNVATLIEDGATLQLGIGAIPNAVLSCLSQHKKLGVHTEMFSDGVIDLFKSGVITGENKKNHPGKIVSGFVLGTKKLYDFIDDNPMVAMLDIAYINNTNVISKNPKVTAINSAIEVDMYGQICADSIGSLQYSGVGGQLDFMRGAALSEGGKPIIALPSITSKGESRIVNFLKHGASVVTTRAHAHFIVTEYGIADLYAKSLKQRAKALIAIAHPNHREKLEIEAIKILGKI